MFGRGDLAAARIALAEANAVVALLEKTREAANKRRAAAAKVKPASTSQHLPTRSGQTPLPSTSAGAWPNG